MTTSGEDLAKVLDGVRPGLHIDRRPGVVVLMIDNPTARNSLSDEVLRSLVGAVIEADVDPDCRCIVIGGSDKVFASGADIEDLRSRTPMDTYDGERARLWVQLRGVGTPLVAAVSGACLGGGAELAMLCDVVIASERSKFGLPETQLGLLPGAGGTQLLPRAVGKALTMDIVLTGRMLDAQDALAHGLVSRVVPEGEWLTAAIDVAEIIASRSGVAQRLAKGAVRASFDLPLTAGIDAERTAFGMAFGSKDGREGLDAFIEKRDPRWTHS